MVKAIVGIVVGYIAFLCVMFGLMTALWFAVGIERVFEPGTFQITPLWIGLALLGSLIAGAAGGFVCSAISKSASVVKVFATIVFILAIIMCIPVMMADQTPKPRRGDLKMMEAMQQGQAPIWMHLASAALAAAGVLLVGRRKT
jgi:hypothetical protein